MKSYTQEFKDIIIELYHSGKTYAEISSKYGVPKTTIRQWVKKNNILSDSINSDEDNVDINIMKRRMARLEQENEILKKALSIFARTNFI